MYPKLPPQEPWSLPKYAPLRIASTYGSSNLPPHIMADDPYEIFTLFFDDETLTILANNTNEYAQVHSAPADKPHTRTWSPTIKEELRAYIAAYVWMGVYLEKEAKDFWNTKPAKGLIHDIVRHHISLKRWEQIDRFFYFSKRLPQCQQTPFDKLEPLSEHLRKKF